jgi:hypothetical protein
MATNQSPPQPSAAAQDAWASWQAKLDASHLTLAEKQQATAVLIKLMKLREERQKSESSNRK